MNKMLKNVSSQMLRGLVLAVAQAAHPLPVTVKLARAALISEFYDTEKEDLESAFSYLADKGLVKKVTYKLRFGGGDTQAIVLTAAGIDFLEGSSEIDGIIRDA